MGKKRAPCCDKTQVRRGPWSDEESKILKAFIEKHGHGNWRSLPKLAGLKRCGKSCRLRWINYLRPDLKRGNFTQEEEDTIIQLHQSLGNKWSKIASHFPGRTDNEIKNVWNTHLKKRLMKSNNLSSPSASSDVTHHSVSPSSSSSVSSSVVLKDVTINSAMPNKEEQFDEILVDQVPCGLEVNAPQQLECLVQDSQIPPPVSKPQASQVIDRMSDHEIWSRLIEPGFDDSNDWLNFFG